MIPADSRNSGRGRLGQQQKRFSNDEYVFTVYDSDNNNAILRLHLLETRNIVHPPTAVCNKRYG